MTVSRKLTWGDYPTPRVKKVKGKYSIVVSVPRAIRHLFGTPEVAKATGTTDRAIAEKKLILFGNELYAKLDQKQIDAERATFDEVDLIAIAAITTFANAIRYRGGRIPPLVAETEYTELTSLKNRLDAFVEQHRDSMVEHDENTVCIEELLEEGKNQGLLDSQTVEVENLSAKQTHALEALRKKISDVRASDPPTMFDDQHSIVRDYGFKVVDSFWQDLLTQAAQQQGHPAPVFDTPTGDGYVKLKLADDDEPKLYPEGLASFLNHPEHVALRGSEVDFQTVERQRQVLPPQPKTVSSVMDEYLERVLRDHDIVDTQKKLKRWAHQFLDVMGDLEIAEIKPKHAYEYCDKILEQYPSRKNTTLKDYCWGVQVLLKHCVERDYIQSNPFRDLDLSRLGKASDEWESYARSELKSIFAYDWSAQDRLLLTLCATTGMLPTEVGNLTWERFNDTEHDGIRYFSTKDTATEQVRVKNRGSARLIPIHPDVELPPKAIGRLFDYEKDADGRCGTDIGHKVNHVLDAIVPHPRKSTRSFRKTFKQMMRDAKVEEEVHDFITGHSQGSSASRKNYGGMGIEVMFEAVSKLDVTFLKG